MLTPPLTRSLEQLVDEFQQWLEEHSPKKYAQQTTLESFIETGRAWQRELARGRWIGTHWPESSGGRGLSLVEEAIIQEILARVQSPQILGLFGLSMVGPVLIRYGTKEQQEKFLARILSADDVWCQGFSEPNAGSDLAALKTTGRYDAQKDGYYLNGQKVWTSFAQIANYCFCLCRTSNEGKKHEGLTYLLVDMNTPGIRIRPLRQISGDSEFNEVFFDEVFVPSTMRVGKEGQGWEIAISTLMHERVVLTFARHIQSENLIRSLPSYTALEPHAQTELDTLVVEACAVRALAYKHLFAYARGEHPGPEGSLDKLFWSESFGRLARFSMEQGSALQIVENLADDQSKDALFQYFYSRGRTIAAGTSEIQKNIIAERILGMPRLQYRYRE